MILGLDHITFNKEKNEKFKFDFKKNFEKKFNLKKKNHPEKKKFLNCFSKFHNLIFYKSKHISPSLEITSYISSNKIINVINLIKNNIIIKTNSLTYEKKFFNKVLGLQPKNNTVLFHSIIENKKYKFVLKKGNFKKYFLDDIGYVATCFIVNNIEKIYLKIKSQNLETTKIFQIEINNQKLKIIIVRSKGYVIYELIEFLK